MTTRFLFLIMALAISSAAAAQPAPPRAKVGVALGGGAARGIAHVGVLRWLEEHRIPIDVVAGTSMGGLIGGSYATGMTPDEIEAMLDGMDWNAMFGSSQFQFANVRRKRDLRSYPSGLEFGLKGGIVPPPSLNNGQQVDLLLSSIAAPYYDLRSFDELPTPFRCVASDLTTAQPVVIGDGSLSRAMRATMSLPLIFPPVASGHRVLVDGGAMNNIPGDIARTMGADRVIAVNVGDLKDRSTLDYSLFGLVMETLDALMRANTLRASANADVMINVPVTEFGSLDWRRGPQLIAAGYQAAESMRDRLLPLAIGEAEWEQWRATRAAARRVTLPSPAFIAIDGAGESDAERMRRALLAHVGHPLDVPALDETLRELGGLDRYETLTWALIEQNGAQGIRVTAIPKNYGPPFMYIGVSLENTTGNEFRFGLAGRYLAFDVLGSGTELRVDAAVGSDPGFGLSWYRPLGSSPLFIQPFGGFSSQTLSAISDGRTIAQYKRRLANAGLDAGIHFGRLDELRIGARYGWTDASVHIGDPGLPEIDGQDASWYAGWTHDGQDDPIVPSRGVLSQVGVRHYFKAPDALAIAGEERTTDGVTQAEAAGNWAVSLDRAARNRLIFGGAIGASFNGRPFATERFALGGPFKMSAFSVGEQRGDHVARIAAGYLRQIMRLPDFIGGPVFAGGWVEVGSAFDDRHLADIGVHTSGGVLADTLIGPVFAGLSFGVDGNSRYYIGIGRIFQ